MAISTSTNLGVGSNLPLEQLLTDMRKVENQSLALINARAETVQSRLSGYGTIKSSIEAFKTASDALGKAETFGALKTSVNGEAFTATASSKAIAGQFSIEVQKLATAQTLTGGGQASRVDALAEGKVKIEITLADGTSKTLTLDKANTSLDGIVKAINGDSSMGVGATLVNDGDPDEPYHLLLTAKKTGEKSSVKSISVTGMENSDGAVTDVTKLNEAIGFTKGASVPGGSIALVETAAQNAELKINGIIVKSDTNTIENAIEGVTLTLVKPNDSGTTNVLSLTRDDTVTSKAISTFVSAYNNLQGVIKTLTSYDVNSQSGSALVGDSLARSVQSQVRGALNATGASGALRTLSQLGITTDPTTGSLKIDDTKLAAALKDNMVDVQNLFAGESGISKQVATVADMFVKSGGVISSATDSMTSSLKDMEKQYQAQSDRIDVKMENYRKQFTALDSMVAQMGSVSSYLTQQLSMLGNMNEK